MLRIPEIVQEYNASCTPGQWGPRSRGPSGPGCRTGQEPVYRWGRRSNDHTERRIERLLALGDDGSMLLRTLTDATTVKHYWLNATPGPGACVHGGGRVPMAVSWATSRFLDAIEGGERAAGRLRDALAQGQANTPC